MARIDVTKTYLPPIAEYEAYLAKIWTNNQLTNQGPLLIEFEEKTKAYLDVDHFHFVTNGTLALQLALRALDATEGEIITTPFTYVATVSSIMWERFTPVFVDIDPVSLCLDPNKIEAAITDKTVAVMPVHVFGFPCDVERIGLIGKKHNLSVIYDAAHAFGVVYDGKKLLSYGDMSICSFHATKLFHTIEGGAVVTSDNQLSDRVELKKKFGHTGDEHFTLGFNAKASEFQAAMGLCNLGHIDKNISVRKTISGWYDQLLNSSIILPKPRAGTKYNYSYYPVLLKDEKHLKAVIENLNKADIFPRRYFYPSLNTLPYLEDNQSCPVSEDVSSRILCLPLYDSLKKKVVERICQIINDV